MKLTLPREVIEHLYTVLEYLWETEKGDYYERQEIERLIGWHGEPRRDEVYHSLVFLSTWLEDDTNATSHNTTKE